MAPQFVDYNADGRIDIVTATFDGSPHVSLRGPEGFAEPERILDKKGERVMLAQFWNYKAEKWDNNDGQPKGHCTSAVVFDWDNDGDHDLLLGSYKDGHLYRQMNEGKPGKPKFTGVNVPVTIDGKKLGIPGGITTPRLVDWDGDGLVDLLVGGYGDGYGKGDGGGVWLYRNVGTLGAPRFAAPLTLIVPSAKDGKGPTRPDTGLYADAVDYDGDGDLDLVVGGYSNWEAEPRELTQQEHAGADELQAQINASQEAMSALHDGLGIDESTSAEKRKKLFEKLLETEEYTKLREASQAARIELLELIPAPNRESFVWLYRRIGSPVQ